jgi:hypothetical protein
MTSSRDSSSNTPLESPAYTGAERRWMSSRQWSDWTKREEHCVNQGALEMARDAEILVEMRKRYLDKDRAKSDALWNGYWYVKEKRDYYRKRVAEECAPWFNGMAFQ